MSFLHDKPTAMLYSKFLYECQQNQIKTTTHKQKNQKYMNLKETFDYL